jgi:hypothetical protein
MNKSSELFLEGRYRYVDYKYEMKKSQMEEDENRLAMVKTSSRNLLLSEHQRLPITT